VIKKHPLFFYLLFTFLLSWVFWTIPILLSLGVYKNNALNSAFGFGILPPLIIAALLSTKALGGKGIKDLGSRFSLKGVHLVWYFISAFTFLFVSLATLLIYFLLDGTPESIFRYFAFSNYISMLPVLLIFAAFEEVGWRGFALPILRNKFNALTASMILGVIWAVWHFPKLISEGTTDIYSFIVLVLFGILFSVFLSWIYENSNGSITLAILTHAAGNAAIYAISPELLTKIGYNRPSIIYVIVLFVLVAAIIFFTGVNLKKAARSQECDALVA
jgi:uncharacterized protein